MRTKGSILTLCGVLFLTAACSGGSGKAQPAPLVEKSTAIAAGDSICKQLNADVPQMVTAFRTTHSNLTDADARDFLVNTLLPHMDSAVGAIHRIGEPTKDRVGFDLAVNDLDKDLSALKVAVGTDPVKVLTNKVVIYNLSAKSFVDYGFKECGKQ
ncbi:MAG TPA: hypothetical protein VGZ52_09330 [Acidimicrobiales bacterium]|nr:hypothetical protein [Acidimicrobiales bacterium]